MEMEIMWNWLINCIISKYLLVTVLIYPQEEHILIFTRRFESFSVTETSLEQTLEENRFLTEQNLELNLQI